MDQMTISRSKADYLKAIFIVKNEIGASKSSGEICVGSTDKFTDVKEGDYYADAVAWAIDQNITTGVSETEFAPKKECTRAEVVTFLYRYYETLK